MIIILINNTINFVFSRLLPLKLRFGAVSYLILLTMSMDKNKINTIINLGNLMDSSKKNCENNIELLIVTAVSGLPGREIFSGF